MKFDIIVFCFYVKYEKSCINALRRLEAAGLSFEKIVFVISHGWTDNDYYINSALSNEFKCAHFICHEEIDWEFGAYNTGFEYLNHINNIDKCKEKRGLIVMNDTVGVHSIFELTDAKRFANKCIEYENSNVPCIVGEVDSSLNDKKRRWIRSCLFALNSSALTDLKVCFNPKINVPDANLFLKDRICVAETLGISVDECNEIYNWLYPNKSGSKYWIGSNSPESDLDKMRRKIICILKERMLTNSLVSLGCSLIDFVPRSGVGSIIYRARRKKFAINRHRSIK